MTSQHERNGALEAVERIVNRGGEADEVLKDVVRVLSELYGYASIWFVEAGQLVRGPASGDGDGSGRYPIAFQGVKVAELEVASADGEDDEFLHRVARLISGYCLVGWDTGGEPWDP